ncbi:MAG: AAA family ATPase [Planctomycetes bacterium]|nr:AAA family ATPase [Planctomycetota bacterium]
MQFHLQPGNLIACRINTHRAQWNGTICENPAQWNCSAQSDFRKDYCAEGVPRCFQLRTFAADDPYFIIDQNGLSWIMDENPNALDGQVLLLYGSAASSEWGIQEGRSHAKSQLFGFYRIRSVEREDLGHRVMWKVRPSQGSPICLEHLRVQAPYFDPTGGPYIQQLQRSKLAWLLQDIQEQSAVRSWPNQSERKRWETISKQLSSWLDDAASRCEKWSSAGEALHPEADPNAYSSDRGRGLGYTPFANLEHQVKAEPVQAKKDAPATPSPTPILASPKRDALLSDDRARWIQQHYGEEVLDSIRVASATKDFMILSGAPGVGKSFLATQLLDDPERERTFLLPISATWRGREDLLGYQNPISGSFEETPFTAFVRMAGAAWQNGDRRPYLVVFEEFNLSPPEHWLSDILTLSQFAQEKDRWIRLGNPSSEGNPDLFLSPALFFVGTVNNDHTTQPLSPRVLDRVALIPLQLTVRNALSRIGHHLDEPLIGAISDLDRILSPRGASFSIRTAIALQDAESSGLGQDKSVDIILLQGMLTRVRLMAHDPTIEGLLELTRGWAEQYGANFPRCAAWIANWQERSQGDVDQFWA